MAFNRLEANTVFTAFCGAQATRVQAGKVAGSPSFAFAFARLEIGLSAEDEEGDVRRSHAEPINIAWVD